MANFAHDKIVERDRYDARAGELMAMAAGPGPAGAASIPADIRTPYLIYEQQIRAHAVPGSQVLDLCCGHGVHSLTAPALGAEVTVSDIAPRNVELTLQRATRAGLTLKGQVADAEHLPWPDASFDLVLCAGSLSYMDHAIFFSEVARMLRPGGHFLCIDSLNHNPLYRFNRYLHYRRGERTLSTLERMPTLPTLALLEKTIGPCQATFHGTFTFLSPLLRPLLGRPRTGRVIDFLDRLPGLRRGAFKFVATARKV